MVYLRLNKQYILIKYTQKMKTCLDTQRSDFTGEIDFTRTCMVGKEIMYILSLVPMILRQKTVFKTVLVVNKKVKKK